jgi:transcriptional regulator with XRE-family HTH domain
MKFENTFGNTIKKLREDNNLTLREVAEVLEIDTSTLGKIEKNSRKPTKLLIENIARYFNVSEKELIIAFLSDSVASYVVKDKDFASEIFKVAEEKVEYLATKQTPKK